MLHRPLPLFLAMSLLTLFGCGRPAAELPQKLSDLHIELSIEHTTECSAQSAPYVRKVIRAVLRQPGGRDIERGDVGVEVNGVPLPFRVATGNYYDRHPYYQLSDDPRLPLAPGSDYRFTLVMPDGTRHEIGSVRMPAPLEPAQFDFPSRRLGKGDVKIAWRDLGEPAALTVYRSDIRREADGTEVHEAGSSNDPAALQREIGPGWFRRRTDRWTIPPPFLASEESRKLSALSAQVKIVHPGELAKTFTKGSTLTAERRLTLRMECEPAQ